MVKGDQGAVGGIWPQERRQDRGAVWKTRENLDTMPDSQERGPRYPDQGVLADERYARAPKEHWGIVRECALNCD